MHICRAVWWEFPREDQGHNNVYVNVCEIKIFEVVHNALGFIWARRG